ncbi:MAG: site-specific integrase [Chloroflexota bacterium]|nr:site-specific integrase [Chloroflexota bacterium]
MQGSIQKRIGTRGTRWSYVIDVGYKADGSRDQRRRGGFLTRRAAQEALTKELHERRSGVYVEPSTKTVGTYLDEWLSTKAATVKPATVHRYRQVIRDWLTPHLGATPLTRLDEAAVQGLYARALAEGLSPATVHVMHAVLRQSLAQAVRWRFVLRNVCDAVEPPRVRPPELTTWSATEARAFLDGTANDDLAGLWEAALLTAMRLGEFLALRWEDVDLERGAVAVRRTVTRDEDGRPMVGVPKGGRNRRVLLAAPAVAALRRHRARQAERRLKLGAAWADAGLVFERGDGIMLTHQAVEERFKRRVARFGLREIRFHDLRHSTATLLLEMGVHPKIVSELLGHAGIAVTMDRYSHVTEGMHREAVERLGDLLRDPDEQDPDARDQMVT